MSCTFDELLYECKINLRLTGSIDHDLELEIWIDEGVRHLDNIDIFEEQSCVLELTDNKIKLPQGFAHWIGLRFTELTESAQATDDDTVLPAAPLPSLLNDMVYLDFKWLRDCNIPDSDFTNNSWARAYQTVCKIRGGYIVFNTNVSNTYSKAQLMYGGLRKDDMGRNWIEDDFKRDRKSVV